MSKTEYQRFMSCTRKIHALAQEDPQADLIASRNVRWRIIKLSGMGYKDMFDMPAEELGKLPFPTRTLIEGLISHGILIPGDVPLLLQTLDLVTRDPVFKEKILESLFNEERIRKVDAIVKGELTIGRTPILTCFSRQGEVPAGRPASLDRPSSNDPDRHRDTHPRSRRTTSAGSLQLGDPSIL